MRGRKMRRGARYGAGKPPVLVPGRRGAREDAGGLAGYSGGSGDSHLRLDEAVVIEFLPVMQESAINSVLGAALLFS